MVKTFNQEIVDAIADLQVEANKNRDIVILQLNKLDIKLNELRDAQQTTNVYLSNIVGDKFDKNDE